MPKKEKVGVVVSTKMSKTIVVELVKKDSHKKYGKIQKRLVRFKAHDPNELAQDGNLVKIVECRPVSKCKTWVLAAILETIQEVKK